MYQIEHFPEVWADACLRDGEGRFLFLSVYGRDTSLLQFMAAMELPRADSGLERFTLVDQASSERHVADVAGTERLAKLSARLSKDTVFGALTQTWIYDTAVASPDIVNRQGWALCRTPSDTQSPAAFLDDRLWALMKHLSPVPLLDPWRECLMRLARESGMIRPLGDSTYPPLGPVAGGRVSLDDRFLPMVRDLVAAGVIALPSPAAAKPLPRLP